MVNYRFMNKGDDDIYLISLTPDVTALFHSVIDGNKKSNSSVKLVMGACSYDVHSEKGTRIV